MKTYTVNETQITQGIKIDLSPYPHITLGEGGHKRATWVPLGKRDAEGLIAPTKIHCRHRGSIISEDICPECQTPSERVENWPPQEGCYARRHPQDGFADGPLGISNVGVLQLPKQENQPPRYLIVAPPCSEPDRVLVFWALPSGYRGSAQIAPGEGTLQIAKDAAYHSGRGNLGETAEALAVLEPGQYLEGHISGRRIQSPDWRCTYLGDGQFEVGPYENLEAEGEMV